MQTALVVVFVLAYTAIALEQRLQVNKSATALLAAGLLWTMYAMESADIHVILTQLSESVGSTAQVIFFLMGAMTIVEVVDAHNGFEVITARIRTTRLSSLLWLIGCVTFFLSAILDNLTTTIVMISLTKKLLKQREDQLFFAGIIVIAANAGGAWSPIGDVTTTMLWIGGQITTFTIMQDVFLAAVVSLMIPLLITSASLRGRLALAPDNLGSECGERRITTARVQSLMFFMGTGALISVPVFKAVTHLPPFMGILFALGIVWVVSELAHRDDVDEDYKHYASTVGALKRIDMSSIIFFMGILLAVAVLEHAHILDHLALWLQHTVGRIDLIVVLTGLASAVIDNVPLVAASMGMYSLNTHPPGSFLWEFLAYCAGTGGSILVIGSAAGVAAMGLEQINFFWYARRIGLLAAVGYFAGAGVFILQQYILG